jgi:uncharacterized membrane protein
MRHGVASVVVVLLLLVICFAPKPVAAEPPEPMELTVFLDGFVQVNHSLTLAASDLYVNVSLLGETQQDMRVYDENNLPVDYTVDGDTAVIYSVGSQKISLTYLTGDLTSKNGKYWTLSANCTEKPALLLPENAVIISLNVVPDQITHTNGYLALTMPSGALEVTYTAGHASSQDGIIPNSGGFEIWQIAAVLSVSAAVPLAFLGWRMLKNKKTPKPKPKPETVPAEVDLDKLLGRHRELHPDEVRVVQFLAGRHGKAFEAELFEFLNLPRTSTWRLIKRLEDMGIVEVKKSRRQNIVLIRQRYLKKPARKT